MTELLEQAIAKLKTLPDEQQNSITVLVLAELEDEQQNAPKGGEAIAALILEELAELESDRHWDKAFASSSDVLAKLAAEAMADYRAGRT